MPRFNPNLLISDCWSSIGNITFYHRNGVCYFRSKPYSEFTGTEEQLEILDLHRRAIRAWQSLDHSSQMIWRRLAKDVIAHRPPFDNTSHISGYNLFVSAYHGYAQLDNEHIPVPQPFEQFPIFSMDYVGSECLSDDVLILRFRLTLCGTNEFSRYRILGKIQFGLPGTGRNPGLMRNYHSPSIPVSQQSEIEFFVPKSVWEESMYQLHMRYLLIDSLTGYRSQYLTLSTLASL